MRGLEVSAAQDTVVLAVLPGGGGGTRHTPQPAPAGSPSNTTTTALMGELGQVMSAVTAVWWDAVRI